MRRKRPFGVRRSLRFIVAVCAAVSPYRATRNDVRGTMNDGHYIEIFVDTPLDVCEERDTKGLYAMARSGELKNLTGVDAPYEAPQNPEIRVDTVGNSAVQNAEDIVSFLADKGFVLTV